MAFVNLKDLKANIGGQLRLTLNSGGVYEEKEWQGKKFNTFKYEVIEDGEQDEVNGLSRFNENTSNKLISVNNFLSIV